MLPAIAIAGTSIALAFSYLRGPRNNIGVKASDGNIYQVQDLPDKQSGAELLCRIRKNLTSVVEKFKQDPNYSNDPPYQRLIARFNPEVFQENDIESNSTSYSENKGEKIVVCLRDKTTKELVDENTIMFVILHEMAHLMTTTIGHTPEFWANFRRILHDGVSVGIYKAVNYSHSPVLYCGMRITDSPL
jgi:hypothetical protein